MGRIWFAILMGLGLLAAGPGVRAAELSAEQLVLLKLFGHDPIVPEMFTPGFLAQVSIGQVLAVFDKTRATVGPPESIEASGKGYVVHTATYTVPVDLGLDPSGRIGALLLHPAVPTFSSADAVLAALRGLGGDVAYLVTRNGQPLHAAGAERPLAVASAFKLAVLAALADEIAAGRIGWDQVVRLTPGQVSLPPGMLQNLPPGSPLTVHTLAAFMVAESDNTATDMLMDLVGRDRVAARLGVDFVLRTGEFFKLKADPALRLRFAGADVAGRRAAIAQMAGMPLPDPADVMAPLDDGIEWYAPLTRLCALAGDVARLDVFAINPGVARRTDWSNIAFKGGSEVGVASLVSALTDMAGNRYCVAVTWNDHQALDETRFTALYGALLDQLRKPSAGAASGPP